MPLLDDCEHYDNCKELARVLWMTAAIMPLMAEDVRSAGPGENGPADPVFPTMEELTEVGVFDLHVRGKNKASAQEEFLTAGSRVANPTPFKLFGREYAEFDDAYVASKRARFEVERREAAAAAAKPSKKRKARETPVDADAATEKQAKKAAKEARHTEFPLPPSAPAYAREAGPDALDLITPTSGLLGFKHATVLGTLKSDLAGFKQALRSSSSSASRRRAVRFPLRATTAWPPWACRTCAWRPPPPSTTPVAGTPSQRPTSLRRRPNGCISCSIT